jgi:hypothetical protein
VEKTDRFLKKILNILFLFLSITLSFAQQYPVKLFPVVIPPYSLKLGDYATSTDNKLQLQVLMTDLMEPQHQTCIKFTLEAGLNAVPFAQSNDFVVGMQPFMLYPGSNITLTNVDLRALFELQNLGGINATQYAQPLSDGVYRYCFQAYDFYTKHNLSDKSCATVFLVQYDPPMLNLPQNAEKVQAVSPYAGGSGIVFQWMPRQIAPNTKYIFTLKELWDTEQSPISGFLSSPPLWREEVYAPTLYYGVDKTQLIPGKRYAWQVQAKSGNPVVGANATDDNGVYKNNGLSEIFYFDYVENCAVPTLLMAKNAGRGRVELSWSLAGQPSGLYTVQYRKRGSTSEWQTAQSYQPRYIVTGLEDQTEYEYRIGSVCGNLQTFNNTNPITEGNSAGNAYSFSGIQYFTTDANASNNSYQCGVMPAVDIANKSPLQTLLGANEVFTAGDFPVTVISAQGSNGIYSGTGYIVVPYLADTKIKVSFSNIKLNTDKKLIEGAIETTYDPNETAVSYVSAGLGETFGDAGVKEVTIDFPIGGITYSATPPPGKITITGSDGGGGTGSTVDYPGGKDYQFTDKDGNIWTVDENGKVTKGGKVAEGGASTSTNTDGVTGSGNNATVSQYTAKGIKIEWKENTGGQFAYDTAEKTKLPKDKYPSVKDSDNNTVYVPYKATVNKQTELFDAKVSITDPALKDAKIIFKTLSVGKEIEATELNKTDTERNYQLKLVGAFDYAEEEVIAVLMPKDAKDKQQVISSFRLVHLSPKDINVALVPTDTESKNKLSNIETQTNAIYKKVGVKINFNRDDVFDITPYLNGSTVIPTEKNTALSTYSSVQQAINKGYSNRKSDRYILFVADRNSDKAGQLGYMRLNGQFGYVFKDGLSLTKTGAHELGHGIFKLEHPFENLGLGEKTTPLLMDYRTDDNDIVLSHLDWKQINDPAFKLYAFQSQSSGELNKYAHLALTPSGNIVDNFYQNNEQIAVTILVAKNYTIESIKYKNVDYTWNAQTKAYVNGNDKITTKKTDKTINDKVNLFRSRGDGCMYDYVLIPWNSSDEATTDVQAKIADRIKAFKDTDWTLSPLDIRDASCNNNFTQALLAQDQKDCAQTELQAGIQNLKAATKLTDAEKVVSTVNSTCMSAIRNLTYTEIESLINTIAGQTTLKEQSELAILRLMTAIKTTNYADFYTYLEKDSNKVLKHLVAEIDDASLYFLTDKKNYTNFIGALVTMFNQAPASLEKRWPSKADDFAKITVNLKPISYENSTQSPYFQIYTTKHNDGDYKENTGEIVINDVYTTHTFSQGVYGSVDTDEPITTVSPLTPIILIPDGDKLPLIATALGENSLGGQMYIVPAIFLKYNSDKIRNDYIEKGIVTTLDLATIYLSGGTALATKVTWVRRAWAMAEVAGAVGNIAANTGTVDPNSNLGKAINAYNLGMAVIGVKNVAQGGYKFVSNLPQATKTLLQENKGLRDLISAQYLEWNSLIMKYKSPEAYINSEVRKAIEEQGSILGQLSGKVLRKFNTPDEISQFLKTDKDGAFFWSGRTSKGKDVTDMALEIAQGKGGNTLEGMLAKYNIDMPTWDASNPAVVKIWEDVSALYATQVSGEVRAVLGKNLRSGNIWEGTELPRLKKNPNVTKIITIDPETMIETIIFTR